MKTRWIIVVWMLLPVVSKAQSMKDIQDQLTSRASSHSAIFDEGTSALQNRLFLSDYVSHLPYYCIIQKIQELGGHIKKTSSVISHNINNQESPSSRQIHNILPLGNYQGTGFLGYVIANRLIFDRNPTAPNDYTNFQFNRSTKFTAGTSSNIASAVRIITNAGFGDGTQEWGVISTCSTAGHSGGLCGGGNFQGVKQAGSTDAVWGSISDVIDLTDYSSKEGGGKGVLGTEVDLEANKKDDAINLASYSGQGVRKIMQLVGVQKNQKDVASTEISSGIWFSSSGTDVYYDSLIGAALNQQARSAVDTRGLIAPSGVMNPVSALVMSPGQLIDFSGGPMLNSAPGRYMTYNISNLDLEYATGLSIFRFTDEGAFQAQAAGFGADVSSGVKISVGGDAITGIDLTAGKYSGPALRIPSGSCIAYEVSNNIKICFRDKKLTVFNGNTILQSIDEDGNENIFGKMISAGTKNALLTVVSKLGSCSTDMEGSEKGVIDADAPKWNLVLRGGGSTHVKARCNGTEWVAD